MNYPENNKWNDFISSKEKMFALQNIAPHCAVILVLDTSHSMWGKGLQDMMQSLDRFYRTIRKEQFTGAQIDIAAVSMGSNLRILEEFTPFEQSTLPGQVIRPKGDTPIGQALTLALDKLSEQEAFYRSRGWSSVMPQLIMLSDGQSTDNPDSAIARIQQLTGSGRLLCRVIATGDAPDLAVLQAIAGDNVLRPETHSMQDAFTDTGRLLSQTYEDEVRNHLDEQSMHSTPEASCQGEPVFLLDGSNILHWDEMRSGISLKPLLTITGHLDQEGKAYQVFFDATARHLLSPMEYPEFEHLLKTRPEQFRQVPAGTRADDFLLVTADADPACLIMTNDRFRDHAALYPWLQADPSRLVPGMILNQMIFFPTINMKIPF